MKAQSFGKYKSLQVGSSTLEILIAFAILTLAFTAVIMVFFSNQNVSIDTQINDEAIYKAQALLEQERASSRQDFSLVKSVAQTVDGIYKKSVDVTLLSDNMTKQVVSNVLWTTLGRNLSVHLTTLIASPMTGGNTCDPTLPGGDWKHPVFSTFDSSTINLVGHANGLGISDLRAYNGELYVSADSTSNGGDSFFIFDLPSDPTQPPVYRGSVNTAPSVSSPDLNALALGPSGSDLYAYVANAYPTGNFATCVQSDKCAQLQVIKVTDPSNPTVVANYKVASNPVITGGGGQGAGLSVYFYKGYIYLGLFKTNSGPEFNMIDVGGGGVGSPTNPVWVGGYSVGHGVTSIFVKDKKAYLALPQNENLVVVDVDPTSPTFMQRIGGFTPGTSNFGESLTMVGSTLYLGRTYGSNELYALDASTPAALKEFSPSSHVDVGSGNTTSINGLSVRDYLAFAITNGQFQVWNIADPTNMYPWSPDGTTATFTPLPGGTGTNLHCDGDRFYVAIASSQGNNKDIIGIVLPGITLPTVTLAVKNAAGSTVTTANVGDTIHASANVTGPLATPTGTLDYTFYQNGTCTAPGIADPGNSYTLDGSGAPGPSSNQGPLNAGSYSYKAHYYGDANYGIADSLCMPLTIAKVTPTVNTVIYNAANNPVTAVTSGTAVYDKMTITGGAVIPTGTVAFTLYKNATCTGGAGQILQSTPAASVNAGVAVSSPNWLTTTANKPKIGYKAVYSGDINYIGVTIACQLLTVN